MDWLASQERALFFALNGHPGGALPRALAVALLTGSRDGLCWWVVTVLLSLTGGRRGRRVAVTAATALALAALAAWGLRGLVERAVPALQYGDVYSLAAFVPPFSFPAARVAESFAAVPFFGRGRSVRAGVVWAVAVLVADAGIYAGAHLPSDALGGAAIGLLAARVAIWLLGSPFRRRPGPFLPLSRSVRRASGPRRPGAPQGIAAARPWARQPPRTGRPRSGGSRQSGGRSCGPRIRSTQARLRRPPARGPAPGADA